MRDAIRSQLAALQALSAKTLAAERQILGRAEARILDINDRLEELRPRTLLDADAADEYHDLILERGRLHAVATQARRHIGA